MGEILQDAEQYFLQLWDEYYNRWNEWSFCSYDEALRKIEQYKKDDKVLRVNGKYRIVKETTKQEVVYND